MKSWVIPVLIFWLLLLAAWVILLACRPWKHVYRYEVKKPGDSISRD